MIDLHCHILPGIDDGPATIEDSVALARAAAEAGTRTMVATSHVSWEYPNTAATIAALVDDVNERFAREQVPIEVRPGAELAMTRVGDLSDEALLAYGLGGGPWLLVECPLTPAASGFDAMIYQLQSRGHRLVLAHPERSPAFHRNIDALAELADNGVLTSVTAGALVGRFGSTVRRFALQLAERGLIHNVASDAHDAVRRHPGMRAEIEAAGLGTHMQWLTSELPAAVLAGAPLPERPPEPVLERPHGWRRFLRR